MFFAPQPEARAIDPVTIAILAPIAIKAAQIMAPYVIRALGHMAKATIRAGKEMLHIFLLPIGLVQSTILAPFGKQFSSGIVNIARGGVAPFVFTWYVLMIPVSAFGVGI